MRKTATIEEFRSWRPCWGENRIKQFSGRRKRWTWENVVALREQGVPDEDWYWLAVHFLKHCGQDKVLRLAACRVANSALLAERKAGREPHKDSFNAIKVARKFARGKATEEALSAAQSAAESAAERVVGSAAWSAARSTAWSAAWRAAWSAACRALIAEMKKEQAK